MSIKGLKTPYGIFWSHPESHSTEAVFVAVGSLHVDQGGNLFLMDRTGCIPVTLKCGPSLLTLSLKHPRGICAMAYGQLGNMTGHEVEKLLGKLVLPMPRGAQDTQLCRLVGCKAYSLYHELKPAGGQPHEATGDWLPLGDTEKLPIVARTVLVMDLQDVLAAESPPSLDERETVTLMRPVPPAIEFLSVSQVLQVPVDKCSADRVSFRCLVLSKTSQMDKKGHPQLLLVCRDLVCPDIVTVYIPVNSGRPALNPVVGSILLCCRFTRALANNYNVYAYHTEGTSEIFLEVGENNSQEDISFGPILDRMQMSYCVAVMAVRV